jgi:hypothetical protein
LRSADAGCRSQEGGIALNSEAARPNRYPFYAFRIAYGMTASAWFPMLVRNHFAISPTRFPFALQQCVYSVLNSVVAIMQQLIFSRRIEATVLEPPVFIIGHWRTGTTLIHELLALDQDFTTPVTLECFAPGQALVSSWLLRWFTFFLPKTRPMDNMVVGWDHPQEDEFALLNLGLGSPYETMIFPNRRPLRPEFLNLTGTTAGQIEVWKSGLTRFLKQVSYRSQRNQQCTSTSVRRVVAKSPPHTARLSILRQLFPAAQFIHVVRNPYEIFVSTVRLWESLYDTQGLQKPKFSALPGDCPSVEEYVLRNMELLYRDFVAQAADIPAGQFCQVRYEDLIEEPVRELRRIYAQLNFRSFDAFRPTLEAYLHEHQAYKPNNNRISPTQRAEVERRWRWYFERYGYRPASLQGI